MGRAKEDVVSLNGSFDHMEFDDDEDEEKPGSTSTATTLETSGDEGFNLIAATLAPQWQPLTRRSSMGDMQGCVDTTTSIMNDPTPSQHRRIVERRKSLSDSLPKREKDMTEQELMLALAAEEAEIQAEIEKKEGKKAAKKKRLQEEAEKTAKRRAARDKRRQEKEAEGAAADATDTEEASTTTKPKKSSSSSGSKSRRRASMSHDESGGGSSRHIKSDGDEPTHRHKPSRRASTSTTSLSSVDSSDISRSESPRKGGRRRHKSEAEIDVNLLVTKEGSSSGSTRSLRKESSSSSVVKPPSSPKTKSSSTTSLSSVDSSDVSRSESPRKGGRRRHKSEAEIDVNLLITKEGSGSSVVKPPSSPKTTSSPKSPSKSSSRRASLSHAASSTTSSEEGEKSSSPKSGRRASLSHAPTSVDGTTEGEKKKRPHVSRRQSLDSTITSSSSLSFTIPTATKSTESFDDNSRSEHKSILKRRSSTSYMAEGTDKYKTTTKQQPLKDGSSLYNDDSETEEMSQTREKFRQQRRGSAGAAAVANTNPPQQPFRSFSPQRRSMMPVVTTADNGGNPRATSPQRRIMLSATSDHGGNPRAISPQRRLSAYMIPKTKAGGDGGDDNCSVMSGMSDHRSISPQRRSMMLPAVRANSKRNLMSDDDTCSRASVASSKTGKSNKPSSIGKFLNNSHPAGTSAAGGDTDDDRSRASSVGMIRLSKPGQQQQQQARTSIHSQSSDDNDDDCKSFASSETDGEERILSAKDKIQVMFLEQRKKERAARLEQAKSRIRTEREAADALAAVPVVKSEHDRRMAAYNWYCRTGMPPKKEFKQRIERIQGACDVTVDDVDLLPWMEGGRRVSAQGLFQMQQAQQQQ